jgi:hypothetical protein
LPGEAETCADAGDAVASKPKRQARKIRKLVENVK